MIDTTSPSSPYMNTEEGFEIIEPLVVDLNPTLESINAEILDNSDPWDAWQKLRILRDERLTRADWTQLADAPLTDAEKTSWVNYRQQLRDLPSTISDPQPLIDDPNHSSWPVAPSDEWFH